MFARLARALYDENKKEKALQVADRMFEIFPNSSIPLTYDSTPMVEIYYLLDETEKANNLVRTLVDNSFANLEYYIALPERFTGMVQEEQNREMSSLQNMLLLTTRYKQEELHKEIDDKVKDIIDRLQKEVDS